MHTHGLASTLRRLVSEFGVLYIACAARAGGVTGVGMSLIKYICMRLYSGMCKNKINFGRISSQSWCPYLIVSVILSYLKSFSSHQIQFMPKIKKGILQQTLTPIANYSDRSRRQGGLQRTSVPFPFTDVITVHMPNFYLSCFPSLLGSKLYQTI
jgi:hypothetical protein